MRYSHSLIPTLKEDPSEAKIVSHRLMLRAGLIRPLTAGMYTWLPLGLRVLRNVETIIRKEMNRAGAQELLMPSVQPAELWRETGRWNYYGKELLRMTDRHGREFCYGPTHEEIISDLARRELHSYRDLPCTLYQIQTKFRDEVRPRFGMMRAREFLMKDAYSFDLDQHGLDESYQTMFEAYRKLFQEMGLRVRSVDADTGAIGGSSSHEFHVLADTGEDRLISCDECHYAANFEKLGSLDLPCPNCSQKKLSMHHGIEVGHVFKLDTRYSEAMNVHVLDERGDQRAVKMGCYGIGASRIVAAAIEQNHDKHGILWPLPLAPFPVTILVLDPDDVHVSERAEQIYRELGKSVETLMDDRVERPGVKFKDADLLGIPWQIVVGKRGLAKNSVTLKSRRHAVKNSLSSEEAVNCLLSELSSESNHR